MGTKERRQREIATREQLFLQTARALICEEGLLNLQMARVAEGCDYATGTLYQHFASKEDLLIALVTDRVAERADLFKRAAKWDATPRDRMFAIAVADTLFVRRNPEYFRLLQFAHTEVIWGAATAGRRRAYLQATRPLGDIVLDIVREAVAAGDLKPMGETVEQVGISVWAQVIGTHDLTHNEGLLEFYEVRNPYELMGRNIHRLLNGFGWRPLFDVGRPGLYENYLQRLKEEVFHELC